MTVTTAAASRAAVVPRGDGAGDAAKPKGGAMPAGAADRYPDDVWQVARECAEQIEAILGRLSRKEFRQVAVEVAAAIHCHDVTKEENR